MLLAKDRAFVSGHAEAVRDYLYQKFILLDGGEFKGFKPEVICAIKTQRTCFHFLYSSFRISIEFGLAVKMV